MTKNTLKQWSTKVLIDGKQADSPQLALLFNTIPIKIPASLKFAR